MKASGFKYRTSEEEIMDDFYLKGETLRKTLQDLDSVNTWLGGNKITLGGIKKLLVDKKYGTVRILDVGCGNGMILREIAEYGRSHKLKFELIGIDANPNSIDIAKDLSGDFPEISFQDLNIFSEAFKEMEADIILCTLTLHHFEDEDIKQLIKLFFRNSRLGVVINDLERSPVAYYLFKAFCAVFINNEIARKDGLISIKRGFKKHELYSYVEALNVKQEIQWKWAFRFQWILYRD